MFTIIWNSSVILAIILVLVISIINKRKKLSYKEIFKGKHVLITGGSSGLGKEIARLLLKEGSHVTIVARTKNILESTKNELLSEMSKNGGSLEYVVADVTCVDDTVRMVVEAEEKQGSKPVEVLFCCAGAAIPGFFIEQDPSLFEDQIKLNYLGTVNATHATVKQMIQNNIKGKIIMTSSTLGLMGMIGYSQYSPTKFAIRGLAECLRQELLPYKIGVHVYFVATIDSPGNKVENESKPEITKIIEDGDMSDYSAESRARTLLEGISNGQFQISSDFLTEVFRTSALGCVPGNGFIKDLILSITSRLALPLWRLYTDHLVLKHHQKPF